MTLSITLSPDLCANNDALGGKDLNLISWYDVWL